MTVYVRQTVPKCGGATAGNGRRSCVAPPLFAAVQQGNQAVGRVARRCVRSGAQRCDAAGRRARVDREHARGFHFRSLGYELMARASPACARNSAAVFRVLLPDFVGSIGGFFHGAGNFGSRIAGLVSVGIFYGAGLGARHTPDGVAAGFLQATSQQVLRLSWIAPLALNWRRPERREAEATLGLATRQGVRVKSCLACSVHAPLACSSATMN